MENEHTLSGLKRKHSELSKTLEHHQAVVRQLHIDLDALNVAIRIFEGRPEPVVRASRASRPVRSAKGEVARVILSTLREAKEPMTARDLTQHVMADRKQDLSNHRLMQAMTARVEAACRHYRAKGLLQSHEGSDPLGRPKTWEIVG